MISLISSLSLTLYLKLLVYIETSLGLPRKYLATFGNLQKFSENVRKHSSGLRNNFGKFSEIFRKWSEIFGKLSKMPSFVCLCNKKDNKMLAWRYEFYVLVARTIY